MIPSQPKAWLGKGPRVRFRERLSGGVGGEGVGQDARPEARRARTCSDMFGSRPRRGRSPASQDMGQFLVARPPAQVVPAEWTHEPCVRCRMAQRLQIRRAVLARTHSPFEKQTRWH
jgi:hypothetical protein